MSNITIKLGRRKKVHLCFGLPHYVKRYFCLFPAIGVCWADETTNALPQWTREIDINFAWLKWSGTILMITD